MRRRGELPEPEEALLGIERASPEQEAEQERIDAEKREQRRLFVIGLMMLPDFRAWIMEWLNRWDTFGQPFGLGPTGFPDPMATQYALGQKSAGWMLWAEFDGLSPELASKMRRGE